MKVWELVDKYGISMNYALDRKLVSRNRAEDVLAYAVCSSGKETFNYSSSVDNGSAGWSDKREAYSFAFIFRSQRAGLIGVINGTRTQAKFAYAFIKQMDIDRVYNPEEVEKALVLEAL
jgi:hypothetical protein